MSPTRRGIEPQPDRSRRPQHSALLAFGSRQSSLCFCFRDGSLVAIANRKDGRQPQRHKMVALFVSIARPEIDVWVLASHLKLQPRLRSLVLIESALHIDLPLKKLNTFQIQIFLNEMADSGYSDSVVRSCFSNVRAITRMAKKHKYIAENPGEDVTMPQAKMADKPVMTREQILALIGAIEDVHDLCLLCIGIFCGPRASEVTGLQWKSWTVTLFYPTERPTRGSSTRAG